MITQMQNTLENISAIDVRDHQGHPDHPILIQKVAEEKGALRICQNEEEHRRQWCEVEKATEEVN